MSKKVLVASLVADDEPWLERFLDQLSQLDYPKDLVRYAFVEGKHIPRLHEWCENKKYWIKHADSSIQDRYTRLAKLRNIIVEEAHPIVNEDYVLWIDCDVVSFPRTLIPDLMKYDAPVVAPAVWIEGANPPQFYDTMAFRFITGQKLPAFHLPFQGLVELSSVGTCYMVASRFYSQSKIRYKGGDSEQVTFCNQVRNLGERVYADFSVKVLHADLTKYGREWH